MIPECANRERGIHSARDLHHATRAYRLIRAARKISPVAGKWATKLVFDSSRNHMRFIPPDLAMTEGSPGAWSLEFNGKRLSETVPLLELAHIDRPVSIVASGPSAADYPWEKLRGRFVIAVNGSPTLLAKHGIRPDLIVVIDDQFCRSGAAHFAAAAGVPLAIEMVAGAVWAHLHPDDFKGRNIAFLERVNSWYGVRKRTFPELISLNERSGNPWILPETADEKFRVGWSSRPELGFFSGRTVTFAALQVAVRLGAKDIEIIGMDLGGGRAYEEKASVRPTYLNEHYEPYILPSFQLMARALAGSGVKISNLSPVCPLPQSLFSHDAA
jgi:KDO transferase-3